ncbi:isoprenylcysteine carboxyl methyltransferase family protein [Vulgatibacter incomptus]|uniref:Alkylpyrone O-methyltransferase n=1 Tax=Vulgatibacter incomptus TaxID=1391653 RepID=A0A0K1PCZ8_9BACT|nr:isoprenylcysteine carboxyl methyltransferase family protein [Vulgatibacter incomptus]AKU91395.1 hypothetical protein AKJ08_1782 [Vulgatibacter incomptus]
MVKLYLLLLALLVAERIFEIRLSRRNARQARERGAVEAGAAHYPAVVALHTLFLVSCLVEPVMLLRRPWPVASVIALGIVVAAQALRYWAVFTLGERWNVRILVIPGAQPVTSGPYRFVRHPNYVAVALEIAFFPLITGAWITAVLFSLANFALLRVRIREEEAALGDEWASSFADKPRFLPTELPISDTEDPP